MASAPHGFIAPLPPIPCYRRFPSSAVSMVASLSPRTAIAEIQKSGVIACLRADNGTLAMEAARAALEGGVSVLEVMMPTPDVLMVIEALQLEFPFSIIGAGTVLNTDDARKAVIAGAKFLTSPATVMEILREVEGSEVLYVPGVMTPTEVLCAYDAGSKMVKVYPATILGGAKYISALKRPFPHIPMLASQGISIDSVGPYLDAGTAAVVLSDAIFDREAMRRGDFNAISKLASLAISEAAQAGRN
ncbi:hypothetical protein HPP92_017630 [Vanilla planifolia]|uniref:Uncharacterized protein n=1 Tax=Vanilla planifolia TaxID=51239 RepID=A0A835QD59_VANPL|nr:hypothetical protein HPP92_018248 [Vanilla planifolia]KAG0468302.1 hypothetical protein HPP92_017630 [Vanilla planifolia]